MVRSPSEAANEKLLLVKGRAGLGNRMLCAATAIVYARLTNRKLLFDWRDEVYSNDGSNVFDEYFLCGLHDSGASIPLTESVQPDVWRGNLKKTVNRIEKEYLHLNMRDRWKILSVDLSRVDHKEDVLVMWTEWDEIELMRTHFTGTFAPLRQLSNESILRQVFRNDLVLRPEIADRVRCFKQERFRSPTVGVHVRYTDRRARLAAILRQVDRILREQPASRLFLATDNLEIKTRFEDRYSRVLSTPHWYPPAGTRAHRNRACPDRVENGREALVDLYLLAECDFLVVDTCSTYSYVARMLATAPEECIVDVDLVAGRSTWWRRVGRRLLTEPASRVLRLGGLR